MIVLLRWCEIIVVWGAVGTLLIALYAAVNLLLDELEGQDGEEIDL